MIARRVLLPLIFVFVSAGCQNSGRIQDLAYVERPVEQLYIRASEEMRKRNYTEAILLFNEVERQHPYSEWANRSFLMSAFSAWKLRRYEEAVATAQRYLSLNPANQNAPYAYYLIAMSYFVQIMDVGRDQKMTELAKDALADIIRRYPDTDYARDAVIKLDMVHDQLAGKEMVIGRWYLRRNQHLPAINRFRVVIENYDTTSHVPEALYRMVEIYLSIGLYQEARAAGAVLGYNYQGNIWYQDAWRLLVEAGLVSESANSNPDSVSATSKQEQG